MTVKIDGSNGLLQNYDYQAPTTGFSYTFTTYNVWFANPAGTLATGTITMPASPVDGMTVTITSTQQITALTINANTGQSIVAGGAVQLNANTNRQYMYRLANTTWYLQNIAAGNVVTSVNGSTGAVTITSGGGKGQAFTSNGTFTIPTGITTIKVTVVGGGGNGGAATYSGTCNNGSAAGGGGGGAAISYLTGLTPANTLSVTVGGAGGTSSVASGTQSISTISATGGATGAANSGSSSVSGGLGGLGSGGTINIRGGGGGAGSNRIEGGSGGASILGGGAYTYTGIGNGIAGGAYGGGGGGGIGSNSNSSGGAGAAGVVLFEW